MKLAISILNRPNVKELVDETRSEYSLHARTMHQFFVAGAQQFADDIIVTTGMPLTVDWQTDERKYPLKFGEFHKPITEEAVASVNLLVQTMYQHWGNFLKISEHLTLGDEFDRVQVISDTTGIIKYSVRDTRSELEENFLYVDSHTNLGFDSLLEDYQNFSCDVCTFGKLVQIWKNIQVLSVEEVIWVSWLRRQAYLEHIHGDEDFGKFVWRFWCARLGVKVRRAP